MYTIAIVSDIHGNLPALQAVVADMSLWEIDQVVNLGDSLSGPLLPAETADFLKQQDWVHLAGNHERQLLTQSPDQMGLSDAFAHSCLLPHHLDWLQGLRDTRRLSEAVFLCHGTPTSDIDYFLDTVTPQGCRPATPDEIGVRRAGITASLIACGHTHLPRIVHMPDGTVIVNPGSVGLPAYEDDRPHPHRMENGGPEASYALARQTSQGWDVRIRSVSYDTSGVVGLAVSRGRHDWAHALRTGFVEASPA
ncbi:metallophosphoesterase family protein [Leeia oryzae]|uniref:metallophosphoesterase family protein n=1 Tax=Leeia oryzae TaxID=356662 RepID=UPI0004782AFB|nr:metallophosphoesterase family protein [Leeia oryzae]